MPIAPAPGFASPIDPGALVLSEHACTRFRERVRPTLDADGARRDLGRLIGEHGRFVAEPPRWLAERSGPSRRRALAVSRRARRGGRRRERRRR